MTWGAGDAQARRTWCPMTCCPWTRARTPSQLAHCWLSVCASSRSGPASAPANTLPRPKQVASCAYCRRPAAKLLAKLCRSCRSAQTMPTCSCGCVRRRGSSSTRGRPVAVGAGVKDLRASVPAARACPRMACRGRPCLPFRADAPLPHLSRTRPVGSADAPRPARARPRLAAAQKRRLPRHAPDRGARLDRQTRCTRCWRAGAAGPQCC